jgi:hypothetical protein
MAIPIARIQYFSTIRARDTLCPDRTNCTRGPQNGRFAAPRPFIPMLKLGFYDQLVEFWKVADSIGSQRDISKSLLNPWARDKWPGWSVCILHQSDAWCTLFVQNLRCIQSFRVRLPNPYLRGDEEKSPTKAVFEIWGRLGGFCMSILLLGLSGRYCKRLWARQIGLSLIDFWLNVYDLLRASKRCCWRRTIKAPWSPLGLSAGINKKVVVERHSEECQQLHCMGSFCHSPYLVLGRTFHTSGSISSSRI